MSVELSMQRKLEEERRRFPLSETITEAEALFDGNLRLILKSAEQVVLWKPSSTYEDFAVGRVIGYIDRNKQELFIYLGLTYTDNHLGRVYPSGFIFATDLEGSKLEMFLTDMQISKQSRACWKFPGRQHLLDEDKFLTSVESHKMRTKGLYEEIVSLHLGSDLHDLKAILDS